MSSVRKVFLSSTRRDLKDYREVVYEAIEGLDGYHCVRMEDFGARRRITRCWQTGEELASAWGQPMSHLCR